MQEPYRSSRSTRVSVDVQLSRSVALALLGGIGTILAGALLWDVYQDWALEGNPLWSTLAENAVPLLLAALLPLLGWSLARRESPSLVLSEAAKWALAGAVASAAMAGLAAALQVLQGQLKPLVIAAQLSAVGALAGLYVGWAFAVKKRSKRQARRSEARLRGLAHSIPGVVYQFYARPDGTYGNYFVSEHAKEVLGLSPDGDNFYERVVERVPSSHREAFLASIDQAVEEKDTWRHEFPYDPPDGKRIWLLGTSTPERRREDGTVIFNGVLLDVTERKRQEREARRRSKAMEAATDGIAILDEEGIYTYANQAHAEVYGHDAPEAFLGETWRMCYGEEELRRFDEEVMPVLREAGSWRGEATGRRADGSAFPQELTLTLLEDGGIVCVVRDITERKEKERELREAKEEAQEAARLKSAMLANMSHEIRTPLTSIIGFGDLLREQITGSLGRFVDRICQSGRRLVGTLDSVLELSRLEAGVEDLEREEVRVDRVAEETAQMLAPDAEEKAIDLQIETSEASGHLNDFGVRRIAENLVENAIKFTPKGGTVTIRTFEANGEVGLEVEDTGVGISEEAMPGIFEAFQQESEGLGREYEGTGLGLSLVKKLTELQGGSIDVETEKGEGARFTVRLPRAETDGGD